MAQAQAQGMINAGVPPQDLLTLVQTLAGAWSDGAPEAAAEEVAAAVVATRRHATVVAVGNLTRPPTPTQPITRSDRGQAMPAG
jgi:hypothetical protein